MDILHGGEIREERCYARAYREVRPEIFDNAALGFWREKNVIDREIPPARLSSTVRNQTMSDSEDSLTSRPQHRYHESEDDDSCAGV